MKSKIEYFVNGEVQHTEEDPITVKRILEKAGFTPPDQYELIRDKDQHKYKDLHKEVEIHNGERFTALFVGPTPTS